MCKILFLIFFDNLYFFYQLFWINLLILNSYNYISANFAKTTIHIGICMLYIIPGM